MSIVCLDEYQQKFAHSTTMKNVVKFFVYIAIFWGEMEPDVYRPKWPKQTELAEKNSLII